MKVRPIADSDREWAAAVVAQHFATAEMVSHGGWHDTRTLPGLLAEEAGQRLGLVHYLIRGDRCEVVALAALQLRRGIGRLLLAELESAARAQGCRLLWLMTTNDNLGAQTFFAALGWKLVAVHRGTVIEARKRKPQIPQRAADGTLIADELEYERNLLA